MITLTCRDILAHQTLVPWANPHQVEQDLLLCLAMQALFQRRRGRDLFDLYWAMKSANPQVDPAAIIESFQHYLRREGSSAGQAEFLTILDSHLADRGFCSDMGQLLRGGVDYDPQKAGIHVKSNLLGLLPK